MRKVVEDGKGIEVNTSYHRYGLGDSTPSKDILRLYRALGGWILSIGSDGHKREELGGYVGEAKEVVRSLGFEELCTVEQMKPMFHKL